MRVGAPPGSGPVELDVLATLPGDRRARRLLRALVTGDELMGDEAQGVRLPVPKGAVRVGARARFSASQAGSTASSCSFDPSGTDTIATLTPP